MKKYENTGNIISLRKNRFRWTHDYMIVIDGV